ncbi:MAG: hypothetical protein Q9219_007448 [cf. Caloplaca sp. 3 TL-2023]
MARPKKTEEQAKDSTSLQISIEDFVRTRDSVVTGLATLQSAVQDLSRAYITHTNTIIGKGPGSSLELLNFANPLGGENGLFSGQKATPVPVAEQGEVKKRKRAPHDKNAPKRPITPYFLYMSYAREGIARDMGSGSTAKQVADEGTHRWNSMGEEEKQQWKHLYGCNYAAYKKKVEAYKTGRPIPEFSKEEAEQLFEEQRLTGHGPDPTLGAADHEEKLESQEDDEGDEEDEEEDEQDEEEGDRGEVESNATSSDEESPEPPKVASPPRVSKRGKSVKERVEKKAVPVKEPPPVERKAVLPEMGRKKQNTKKREARAVGEKPQPKEEAQIATISPLAKSRKDSDMKQKRKKRKSEANNV